MAVQAAEEIGFPVTLKAISGGGGMGLTPVHRLTWYEKGLRLYNQEERPFAKILEFPLSDSIQQVITEIQVFGNGQGQTIHIGKRESFI